MAKKKFLEDILLLVFSVIILTTLARILHLSGAIMNVALSVKIAGVVGFVFFALLAAFTWKILRKEKWAIRLLKKKFRKRFSL